VANRSTVPPGGRPGFETLVSVACHDLRTPLATVHGFARTLERAGLEEPAARYVEMIEAASGQIAELLDELSLVTRIERGRYEPHLAERDLLELASEAAAELPDGEATAGGEGASVLVDVEAARRAIRQLARAARRHGGIPSVAVTVLGTELEIAPLAGTAQEVVTAADIRELGAAAAVWVVEALGGSVVADGEVLRVAFRAP
jgi:signal transduction histidine kinase